MATQKTCLGSGNVAQKIAFRKLWVPSPATRKHVVAHAYSYRLRQEGQKFEASVGYVRPVSKINNRSCPRTYSLKQFCTFTDLGYLLSVVV